jgi:hypothetical protein
MRTWHIRAMKGGSDTGRNGAPIVHFPTEVQVSPSVSKCRQRHPRYTSKCLRDFGFWETPSDTSLKALCTNGLRAPPSVSGKCL